MKRALPTTEEQIKRWCREAFYAGRSNGVDSSPGDADYAKLLVSSEINFEEWWRCRLEEWWRCRRLVHPGVYATTTPDRPAIGWKPPIGWKP